MGSSKVTDTKPNISMEEHKRTIKEYLKKPFQALFGKSNKEKKKHAETTIEKIKPVQIIPVDDISESLKNLQIEKQTEEVSIDEEEELKNFTKYLKVKDDSEDSGYTDKCSDSECEQDKSNTNNETDEKKTRKKQTIVLPRKPPKNNVKNYIPSVQPYPQIRQVNRQTFSGGQVIVNPDVQPPIDEVLKGVDINVQRFELKSCQEKEEDWHIAQWFINKREADELAEELSRNDALLTCDVGFGDAKSNPSVFLTPPRSENSLSPLSESHNSYYPTTDFTMSPDMYNSDYEKYQEIVPLEEYPSCVTDTFEEKVLDPSKPERASMTMKQFKDLQKEIANRFSKMECCQENRKPCKEIFKEHLHRLTIDERKDLCLKVADLDLDGVYGVLHHILLNLSNGDKDEDIKLSLFMLICEKVLALKPMLFVNEFGLNLLKAAVFRCHSRPLLTRYLVQCIRVVTRGDSYTSTKGHVFHEVDAAGDTVVSACARAGDAYAPVLAELVRAEPADHPLFDVHHVNADGYTALHVACMEHSAAAPRTHAVHVLLQHAGADLWRGDIKGGDTAVHVAVNSAGCLTLLLLLFRPLPRADWKKLAHAPNRSSVTPLEYARSAVKSASRPNYPPEVLDFLKKCR